MKKYFFVIAMLTSLNAMADKPELKNVSHLQSASEESLCFYEKKAFSIGSIFKNEDGAIIECRLPYPEKTKSKPVWVYFLG